jgi:hypothetical protein
VTSGGPVLARALTRDLPGVIDESALQHGGHAEG